MSPAYSQWLGSLKPGDAVTVQNGAQQFSGIVTHVTPGFICISRLKFRRKDGWLSGHYKKRMLRLVQGGKND
jgi:hypothetical protein